MASVDGAIAYFATGEQVEAVLGILLKELNAAHICHYQLIASLRQQPDGTLLSRRQALDDLYQAMIQLIMRCVVLLFMEARQLVPIAHQDYQHDSLAALYERLHSPPQSHQSSAWPCLCKLFTLLYRKSMGDMPDFSTGGMLFHAGDQASSDGVLRALALFEDQGVVRISDERVLRLLTVLTYVHCQPVDFAVLHVEAIGQIYQRMLDFRLYLDDQGEPTFYLARRGGRRKGSGTFYTQSQLTRLIAQRTLEPLVYTTDSAGQRIPRPPQAILALKICDPACGTGSFLSSALDYLATALQQAYRYYDEQFAGSETYLRRQIAAHCLYGVDLCPFTVELARISLWLEVADRRMALTCVDGHIKTGNALIGAWEQTTVEDSVYQTTVEDSVYNERKQFHDRWCARWFWPSESMRSQENPMADNLVAQLVAEHRFFHWQLEFPEIFQTASWGFDACLANPPWEALKPGSREFFSEYDPGYLAYDKQEALSAQQDLFQVDQEIETAWLARQAYYKNISNWIKHASTASDKLSLAQAAATPPFRYQGSGDFNTYKLFLELAHYLLKPQGYLGMLVPAGIYSDQGTAALRRLFLDHCTWRLLISFVNRRHIFPIHSSFKFAFVLIQKGGTSRHISALFNQEQLAALECPEQDMLQLSRQQIATLSPGSLVILEVQKSQDSAILEKLYAHAVLLGEQLEGTWRIRYAREFDMTSDSMLFSSRHQWEQQGYRSDHSSCWHDPQQRRALPLYEGRMIGAFDPSEKGWISGRGRRAVWQDIPFTHKRIQPQYLMALATYQASGKALSGNKIGFMDICSASNTRSMYASMLHGFPCGNVIPVLQPANTDIASVAALAANLNSFVYDYALRCRLSGLHLNYFIIAETPLLPPSLLCQSKCVQWAAQLNLIMPCYAPQWLELRLLYPELGRQHWRQLWALTVHERLRLRCMLDALIADLYGLDYHELAWILRPDPQQLKGFWRVDKEKPYALRHTALTLAAFAHLRHVGRDTFEVGEWQFPIDIATQLGPRLTPWQMQGNVAESWSECEQLAENMYEE
ncbi:hypothetical protein KDW_37750 [Dictyobacter vulcani]|uniref:site-specific DNA-methyltransferase (adenine-specific) n=1 Tax=Dictyobacter vulcani TaxID=2607529 RepID=A0A5J4KPU0_9CHLR|nr:N-6 DNA methylase [Dictyobacter vulcani]GER89613.1 hypothetical protein KDW_37750 [Dictyobacter vulcani]